MPWQTCGEDGSTVISLMICSAMKPFLLLLSVLTLAVSCTSKKMEKKIEPTGRATLIGMIEMVNPEQNYVLIRCEPMPALAPGTELIALSANGEKSKLVLTPERKGYYITADIKEGNPGVTNLVLHQHAATPPAQVPETPVTPAPTIPDPTAYQPMPTLPGIVPMPTPGSTPSIPSTPQPTASGTEPKGFDGLEPPVGGPPPP
jgi:hypothetical protein